jgi:phosphatidylglycerol:prolipoprotein diacylglycerol transferase
MYPTLIDFGPIAIHSFGLMMALAFLTVMFLLQRELARKGLDPRPVSSIVFASAVGGIVGAKLYSALRDGRIEITELFSNSGLVWFGGVIGALAAVLYVIYRSPNPILPTLDALGPLMLLAHGIGRIGCFLAGDGDYGPPSNLPWAMAFPNGTVPTTERVHPTPLYETGLLLIGFGLLWRVRKQKEGTPGWISGGYLILAGCERFFAEFWRLNPRDLFGLTDAQLFSILLIIIGGWLIYWATHRSTPAAVVNVPTAPPPRRRRKRRKT